MSKVIPALDLHLQSPASYGRYPCTCKKIKVKSQAVKKLQWKQAGRRTRPNLSPGPIVSSLMRPVTRYIAPGASRRYAPADGSPIQKSRLIYVRPRTGTQSAHLWCRRWKAAGSQRAYSLGWDRKTDRQTEEWRYRLMLPLRRVA